MPSTSRRATPYNVMTTSHLPQDVAAYAELLVSVPPEILLEVGSPAWLPASPRAARPQRLHQKRLGVTPAYPTSERGCGDMA